MHRMRRERDAAPLLPRRWSATHQVRGLQRTARGGLWESATRRGQRCPQLLMHLQPRHPTATQWRPPRGAATGAPQAPTQTRLPRTCPPPARLQAAKRRGTSRRPSSTAPAQGQGAQAQSRGAGRGQRASQPTRPRGSQRCSARPRAHPTRGGPRSTRGAAGRKQQQSRQGAGSTEQQPSRRDLKTTPPMRLCCDAPREWASQERRGERSVRRRQSCCVSQAQRVLAPSLLQQKRRTTPSLLYWPRQSFALQYPRRCQVRHCQMLCQQQRLC